MKEIQEIAWYLPEDGFSKPAVAVAFNYSTCPQRKKQALHLLRREVDKLLDSKINGVNSSLFPVLEINFTTKEVAELVFGSGRLPKSYLRNVPTP